MARIIDVREDDDVGAIIFAESEEDEVSIAHSITRNEDYFDGLAININDDCEHVIITSAEHARALIKALEAAISLGWVK